VRREHHPFWVQKVLAQVHQRWAEHFLVPQFDSVGREPRFSGAIHMHLLGGNIHVGDHFHAFATREAPLSFAVAPYDGGDGRLEFGNYCVVSPGVRIRSASSIQIGHNCMLAEHVYITDADWHDVHHRIYPGKRAPVVLGDNVWVGDRAAIFKGVTIGDNSIIGACSVVTRDVPANSIAAGNPAKVVKAIDGSLPFSKREHLFQWRPYDEFKDEYDRARLAGNTLRGWVKAKLFPDRES